MTDDWREWLDRMGRIPSISRHPACDAMEHIKALESRLEESELLRVSAENRWKLAMRRLHERFGDGLAVHKADLEKFIDEIQSKDVERRERNSEIVYPPDEARELTDDEEAQVELLCSRAMTEELKQRFDRVRNLLSASTRDEWTTLVEDIATVINAPGRF